MMVTVLINRAQRQSWPLSPVPNLFSLSPQPPRPLLIPTAPFDNQRWHIISNTWSCLCSIGAGWSAGRAWGHVKAWWEAVQWLTGGSPRSMRGVATWCHICHFCLLPAVLPQLRGRQSLSLFSALPSPQLTLWIFLASLKEIYFSTKLSHYNKEWGTIPRGCWVYNRELTPEMVFPQLPFLFFKFFNWNIVALQCCVSVGCITAWVSCIYISIPSLSILRPTSPSLHSTPLDHYGASSQVPCASQQLSAGWLVYTWWCIDVNAALSVCCPSLPDGRRAVHSLHLLLCSCKQPHQYPVSRGFLGDSDSKESACNAGALGLIPGSGRSPGEGNGNPLQYSCLENPLEGES